MIWLLSENIGLCDYNTVMCCIRFCCVSMNHINYGLIAVCHFEYIWFWLAPTPRRVAIEC